MRSAARLLCGLVGCWISVACDSGDSVDASGDTTGSGGDATAAQGPGPSTGPGAGKGAGNTSAANAATTGAGGGGNLTWTELIADDWSLEPFSEDTSHIATRTLDRDIYVGAIRPIAPPGTHHTLLGRGSVLSDAIYASGVGTNAVVFPPGVGLKLPQGLNLMLQLHIFNPVGDPLSGHSGIEIVEVAPGDVTSEANILLAGPMGLSLPPNQQTTVSGTCTADSTQQIFALFPHMHQLGSHFKTTLTIGGNTMVLHDEDYQFEHQPFISFAPITLNAGDQIHTECTYDNMTSQHVGWGESSTSEMCFSILYRFPGTSNGLPFCNN